MLVSEITEKDLTVEMIDRLLFDGIEDSGECGDCIIVLGSTKAAKYRVPAAVELYKSGRAGKVMLCGGAVHEFSDMSCTEAEQMCKAAFGYGIPEKDIILETFSQNTIENILFSMIELQRNFQLNKVGRILLVTTAYHMRRSLAVARYLFPKHISVIPCPAEDSHTRRDNWMDTPIGIERARDEALNIVRCVVGAVIPDFEI